MGAALEHWGPAGRFDHRIDSAAFEDGRWRVRVRRSPSEQVLEVELTASRTVPHQLTCRGPQKAMAVTFTVESVTACSTM